ncbi:ubiquitin carboxyl-terminal hydrolase 35 isoform X2 [Bacillus rossius redtenbacheri]|uniref:ubiquitin carboxyl-terminal hydrolase 35 isoform X2 n=1 Tax=Bacillus rossius redtenbacheri TaxID=93214 RepID=UPI002FDCAC4E
MVINKLKEVVSLRAPDRVKKCLISECLRNNELNSSECQTVLEWAFRCVVSSDSLSVVAMGWETLKSLEGREDVRLDVMITCDLVDQLFQGIWPNRAEVPALLTWCVEHNTSEELLKLMRKRAVNMVILCTGCSAGTVLTVLELLDKFCALPSDPTQLAALTEAVSYCLAMMPMPATRPLEVQEFFSQAGRITAFLRGVWAKCSQQVYRQMARTALKVIYSAISNTALKESGCYVSPALACLLELVGPEVMPGVERAMVQGGARDEDLVQMVTVLCTWLLQAPRCSSVPRWVLALVAALEAECRYEVLLKVVSGNITEQLFRALQLPAVRPGVAPVLWHFLAASRRQDIFVRVAGLVPMVAQALLREGSEASHQCLHTTLDMCRAYMDLFPGHDELYRPILAFLKELPQYPSKPFLKAECPVWFVNPTPIMWQSQGCVESESHTRRIGLVNLGNTCYMNSVLQALFKTKRFCHALLSASCTSSQTLLEKLQDLFTLLMCSQRPSLSPDQVFKVCRPVDFQTGHQQDSSEFLTHLLDALHEEELRQVRATQPVPSKLSALSRKTAVPERMADEEDAAKSEEEGSAGTITRWTTEEDLSDSSALQKKSRSIADFSSGEGDDTQDPQLGGSPTNPTDRGPGSPCLSQGTSPPRHTIVQQCFGGKMLTTYQCHDCKADSVHTDMFRDIQLSFPGDHDDEEHSLQGLVEYFLSPEELCGDNRYWCEKCGGLRDATRSLAVLDAPYHLLLTLKHFRYDSARRQRTKLLHRVTYSGRVSVPVVGDGRARRCESYRLYAAVVHSGKSMDSGHYYTYALDDAHALDGCDRWFEFNDDVVLARSVDSLSQWHLADTPYILFYVRESASLLDAPGFSGVSGRLEELVARDTLSYIQETRAEEERRRKQEQKNKTTVVRQHPWNGDDEDPPGGCGDGVHLSTEPNRFIF